jgi:four helix bundle protein
MSLPIYDLEERMIAFALQVIHVAEQLPGTKAGNHLAGQMIRSGTSSALNYGEAQAAESKADFIHKLRVVLKELRETYIALRISIRLDVPDPKHTLKDAVTECNELIAIFVASIRTARGRERTDRAQ